MKKLKKLKKVPKAIETVEDEMEIVVTIKTEEELEDLLDSMMIPKDFLDPMGIPNDEEEPPSIPEYELHEGLSLNSTMRKMQLWENRNKIRQKQLSSTIIPDGWEVQIIVDHNENEIDFERTVLKEKVFWEKYKPQFEYDIIRPGNLVSVIIRRSKSAEELAKPIKKQKKVK